METKKWYQSKAIWMGIITAVIGAVETICRLFGVDLNTVWWFGIIVSILGACGIYGRVNTTTKIEK